MSRSRRWMSAALLGLGMCGAAAGGTARAQAEQPCGAQGQFEDLEAIALTQDQRLLCFRESDPEQAVAIGAIAGTEGGERIVGIDFRPRDGRLYGLGDAGGVYSLDPASAVAQRESTLVGTGAGAMPVSLDGRMFGVDFDPVEDRLRAITERGQALAIDVDSGRTRIDAALADASSPDVRARGLAALAYTNNDTQAATGTVLYAVDARRAQLAIVAPPAAGTLNVVGSAGGNLGMDGGFDIFTQLVGGEAGAARALAVIPRGGAPRVFAVDLTTGRFTEGGRFRGMRVIGLAIPLIQGAATSGGAADLAEQR